MFLPCSKKISWVFLTAVVAVSLNAFAFPIYERGDEPAPQLSIRQIGTVLQYEVIASSDIHKIEKPRSYDPGMWSAQSLLNMGFNRDDLIGFSDSLGLGHCRSINERRQVFADFARMSDGNCLRVQNSEIKSPETKPFLKSIVNRISYRAATQYVSTNPTIKTLVEGKLNLDFSFSEIVERRNTVDARPEYVLEVTKKKVGSSAVQPASNMKSLVGSTSSHDEYIVEKKIIERWPTLLPNGNAPAPEVLEGDSFGKRVAKKLGLGREPFSRYRLRLEKTSPGLGRNFLIRFEEVNEIAFVDVSKLTHGETYRSIAFGARFPYYAHSIGVEYPNLDSKPISYYKYWINDATHAVVSYHRESNTYRTDINWLF